LKVKKCFCLLHKNKKEEGIHPTNKFVGILPNVL